MALDTKYRPRVYADVLGQEETATVLREYVRSGAGFHQSYLFCGGHGSGKTTLGRILARALLCESPVDGGPCDQCHSCRSILTTGMSECFTEFDAATNSGKDSIKEITESIQYDTFSGKRRVFLMDEAHRLSKDALDALLIPMENSVPGSEDKLMVCIFCTTEPEKMRGTIFSRCAPAFVIRTVTPEKIADRLVHVCQEEGIEYERDALVMIGEAVESHIRDALKAVEGVSKLGKVDMAHTSSYLRLNTNPLFVRILASLGTDLALVFQTVEELSSIVSPSVAYEKLAELSILAFAAVTAGRRVPVYWKVDDVMALGARHSAHLINFASTFASKPGRPTYSMLSCDLATLHYRRSGEITLPAESQALPLVVRTAPPIEHLALAVATPIPISDNDPNPNPNPEEAGRIVAAPVTKAEAAKPFLTGNGVYVDPRAINRRSNVTAQPKEGSLGPLEPEEFKRTLQRMVGELSLNGRHR